MMFWRSGITLENMAIEKACANMTDADIRKLEQAAEVFQTSTAEGDLVKMAEADVNFHEVIYEAADNKRLMQVLNNLREQIYRYRVEYLKEDESRNRLVKEHEKITRALKERDVKAAQELSFEHLENQRDGELFRRFGQKSKLSGFLGAERAHPARVPPSGKLRENEYNCFYGRYWER